MRCTDILVEEFYSASNCAKLSRFSRKQKLFPTYSGFGWEIFSYLKNKTRKLKVERDLRKISSVRNKEESC